VRRVLMISPHFPPDSSAGTHRVRLLAPHMAAHGWEPTVLTVDPRDYEGRLDEQLAASVPDSVRVVRARAWDAARTRRLGIGDLGLRAYTGLKRAAMDLLADDLPAKPADTKPFEDESASDLDDLVSADGDGSNEAGAEDDSDDDQLHVYGDAAYGAGELQERFEDSDIANRCKVQPASAPQGGLFSKDEFDIDLQAGTVGCPAGQTAPIRPARGGGGTAEFGRWCWDCPLASQCTSAAAGRTVRIGRHERVLARERAAQVDPAWQADYRATRPKVERKIAHLMRHRHGGRRARVRGLAKVAADFSLLAAGINLARLGVLNVSHQPGRGWVTAVA